MVKPADDAAPLRVRVELGADGGDPAVIASHCAGVIATEVGVEADVEVVERGTLVRHGYKQVRLVDR